MRRRHCAYCGRLCSGRYACYEHRDLAIIEAAIYGRKSRPRVKGKGSSKMQADKVSYARKMGVQMGSAMRGVVIGWTTNEATALKCREKGMKVTEGYNKDGPPGWEIVALPDPPPDELAAKRAEKEA